MRDSLHVPADMNYDGRVCITYGLHDLFQIPDRVLFKVFGPSISPEAVGSAMQTASAPLSTSDLAYAIRKRLTWSIIRCEFSLSFLSSLRNAEGSTSEAAAVTAP